MQTKVSLEERSRIIGLLVPRDKLIRDMGMDYYARWDQARVVFTTENLAGTGPAWSVPFELLSEGNVHTRIMQAQHELCAVTSGGHGYKPQLPANVAALNASPGPPSIDFSHIKTEVENILLSICPYVENPHQWYLAGGAITSMLLGETPRDYDFFCSAKPKINRLSLPTNCAETPNAVTFLLPRTGKQVQLVTRVYGGMFEVTRVFDFAHCMLAGDGRSWHGFNDPYVIDAIKHKRLNFSMNTANPISALIRAHKFMARGWELSENGMQEILLAVAKVPPAKARKMLAGGYDFGTDIKGGQPWNPISQKDMAVPEPDETLVHREPNQDDDGMITGMDGKKRWL